MNDMNIEKIKTFSIEKYIENYNLEETLHCIRFLINEDVVHIEPCNLNNAMKKEIIDISTIEISIQDNKYIGIYLDADPNDTLDRIVAGYSDKDLNSITSFTEGTVFFKQDNKSGLSGMTLKEVQDFFKIIKVSKRYEYIRISGGLSNAQ